MSASLSEIARRRGELIGMAAVQREAIAGTIEQQRAWTGLVETGIALYRLVRANKLLLLVSLVAFAAARPRRLLRWAGQAWAIYRLVRNIRRTLVPRGI